MFGVENLLAEMMIDRGAGASGVGRGVCVFVCPF